MQAVVLHHQQPYRRRHVLGRRRASRTVQLPRSAVRGGRAGYSTLPGIRHSQAEEQAHLAQEELQRQSTLGEDEGLGLGSSTVLHEGRNTSSGSYRWRWGTLKECQKRRSREELEETVIEEVDDLKKKFKPAAEINSQVLARPGFLAAYNALTADMLGVYRPNLKIVTMVGPPGTGKSFAINTLFPKAGRAIIGNGGTWFANPTSTVMVFEEFAGQIPLQKMLKLLDPYPMALEVKGGMRPAMYTLAIITSNTRPDGWYRNEEQDGKRSDALLALWDRLGFSNGTNRCYRTCGTYLEPVRGMALGATGTWIDNTRTWFMNELAKAAGVEEHEELSDEALSQVEQDKLEDDIASLDVGDGNTAPSPSQ